MPPSPINHENDVPFVSLGMVILDEIRFPSKAPIFDVMGGSGCYGARLMSSIYSWSLPGCLLLAGEDFPEAVIEHLCSWNIQLEVTTQPQRLSTRGLLSYQDDTFERMWLGMMIRTLAEHETAKTFKYTTESLKPRPADLENTPLLAAQSFHLLATPEDFESHITQLKILRRNHGIEIEPIIIWEPFPAVCKPQNRDAFVRALAKADVFSPNHLEITALFEDEPAPQFSRARLEVYARDLFDAGGRDRTVVVRAAEHGSLTVSTPGTCTWMPAFYEPGAKEVVDPTGGGNTFLGGFALGLVRTHDVLEATSNGHVAASYAVEQVGLPLLDANAAPETWNGTKVSLRLDAYKAKRKALRP